MRVFSRSTVATSCWVPHGKRCRPSYERATAEQCVEAVERAARRLGHPPTVICADAAPAQSVSRAAISGRGNRIVVMAGQLERMMTAV